MPTTIETRLLTVREVAEALRLSRGSIYRKIRGGELPAVYIGGTVRVPSGALARALSRSSRGPGFAP
jgi:excisionase family DNA binding protein